MQKRKIDELISHFNRKVADMDIDREYKMELLGMITAIGIACEKELSIEPERKAVRWIPCSERLPEDYEDVLVWFEYFRYGNYNCLYQMYGIGSYSSGYNSWLINQETGWNELKVFAWMPLPEPYKGEQE